MLIPRGIRAKKAGLIFGFGFNNPTADLAAAYEPNDKRKSSYYHYHSTNGYCALGWGFRVPRQRFCGKRPGIIIKLITVVLRNLIAVVRTRTP